MGLKWEENRIGRDESKYEERESRRKKDSDKMSTV